MRKFLLIYFLLISSLLFSQKEDMVWIMSSGVGIDTNFTTFTMDFRFDPPKMEKRFQDYYMTESNASICDTSGNLFLYCNGVDIHNQYDELIINGGEIQPSATYPGGYPYIQSGMFLPYPGDLDRYGYFHGDIFGFTINNNFTGGFRPLTYTEIDFSSSPIGEVVIKRDTFSTDTLAGGLITAVRNGNGRDWWLVNSKHNSNVHPRYLFSPNGVTTEGSQIVGDTTEGGGLGQAAFSPDGKWYARYGWYGTIGTASWSRVDLYRFDRCTGLLSEHQYEILPRDDGVPGGISFSPNSELMYVSAWDTIYQYNLAANDILASRTIVAAYDGFLAQEPIVFPQRFFMMQLAPNDKIYISIPNINSKFLHVIDQPNELGTACNVLQHSVELIGYNNFALPNLPNFRLGIEYGSPCDTLRPIAQFSQIPDALDITFTDESQRTPTAWLWTFGDGDSSSLQNPQHLYAQQGTYEVCLIVSNEAGSDTTCQMIAIILDGLEELAWAQQIKISPNPTSGYLMVELPKARSDDWEMVFYDAYGRVLLEKELPQGVKNVDVLLSDFAVGVYFYKIRNGREVVKTGKVVKE